MRKKLLVTAQCVRQYNIKIQPCVSVLSVQICRATAVRTCCSTEFTNSHAFVQLSNLQTLMPYC